MEHPSVARRYVISVVAEESGLHPQTIRLYERRGLLSPGRTPGGTRRYSDQDMEQLKHIVELLQAGLNIVGVQRVLELEQEIRRLKRSLGEA